MTAATPSTAGLVLSGGQGQRMGGIDKGLQPFMGKPLVSHALARLHAQTLPVTVQWISANRHLDQYASLGVPVLTDAGNAQGPGAFAGPLAGLLAGLRQAMTAPVTQLLCVPCDSPALPTDLCERLSQALDSTPDALVAVAVAPDAQGVLRRHPVCCLLRWADQAALVRLHDSLAAFLAAGEHKVGLWQRDQGCVTVPFDQASDAAHAFANVNTLQELHALADQLAPPAERH